MPRPCRHLARALQLACLLVLASMSEALAAPPATSASRAAPEGRDEAGADGRDGADEGRLPRTPCLTPEDCRGPEGSPDATCVAWVCRAGPERTAVARSHTVAVVVALADARRPGIAVAANALAVALRADLARSGFYDVLPEARHPAGFARDGLSDSELRRHAWLAAGASRLIRLAVPAGPEASLHVTLRDLERWGPAASEAFVLRLPLGDAAGLAALSARFVNGLVGRDTGLPAALGQRLVGTSLVSPGVKEIVVVGDDGYGWRQLTRNGDLNLTPAWGPRGEVGWMSYETGNTDWWVAPSAGASSDPTPVAAAPWSTRPGLNAAAAWSPDGRWVALALSDRGDAQLVLLDAASGAEHARLTDVSHLSTGPSWSPDSRELAFVSDLHGGLPQLFAMDLATGATRQLTHEGYNGNPDWSPLGDTIAFQRQFGSTFEVMRLDLRTGAVRRLTHTPRGSAESPSFSGDGRFIAYHVVERSGARLWVMQADGSAAAPLGGAVAGRSFLSPAWEAPRAGPAPWPPRDLP